MPEVHGKPVTIPEPEPVDGPLPENCDHFVDEDTVTLDCEPTNEWRAECVDCGATVIVQTDGAKPDAGTEGWA